MSMEKLYNLNFWIIIKMFLIIKMAFLQNVLHGRNYFLKNW